MAARFAKITRLLSRTYSQVSPNFINLNGAVLPTQRSLFSYSRLRFSNGSFGKPVVRCDCFKVCCISRGFSTSFGKFSSNSDGDTNLDYSNIPSLLKESLRSRSDEQVFETQMEVLEKLVQYKSGATTIDAVRSHISYLSPQQIYELAASIFGLVNTVGSVASEMAAPLFWMGSLAGNTDAKYSYAKLLQLGEGVEADSIEAGKMFKELAEKGHPFAQFSLAQMYYSGAGVDQDYKLAHSLLEVSAKNGILPAYTFLGNMYRTGQGVEEDKVKAVEFYKEGNEKGDIACTMALAYCYGHGDGVNEDSEKSFEFHQRAANIGHPAAQYNVGVHYFAGKGVTLNMTKAAEWFEASADQGFELAQINLGNMYYNGLGVKKDTHKARDLYQKAAERNVNAKALLEEVEKELGNSDSTT